MKKLRYILPLLFAALAFTACGEQDAEDHVSGAAAEHVYFPQTSFNVELEPTDPTEYEIEISRADTTEAETVPMAIEGAGGITVSDAVFAAMQKTTTVTVSFPNAEVGKAYTVYLTAKTSSYTPPCKLTFARIKWNEVGTGTYTYDDGMWEGDPAEDKGLVLQQRDDDPTIYRIVGWLSGSTDFQFTYNEKSNEYTVTAQPTGVTHPSYGMIYIKQDSKNPSTWDEDTKTYHFYVEYYVSAGSFGTGEETFTLDN